MTDAQKTEQAQLASELCAAEDDYGRMQTILDHAKLGLCVFAGVAVAAAVALHSWSLGAITAAILALDTFSFRGVAVHGCIGLSAYAHTDAGLYQCMRFAFSMF